MLFEFANHRIIETNKYRNMYKDISLLTVKFSCGKACPHFSTQ